jgi:hypothetical protein
VSEKSHLKTKRAIAEEFGVCTRTIDRWQLDKNLGFPTAIEIRRRAYFTQAEIDEFKLEAAKRCARPAKVA